MASELDEIIGLIKAGNKSEAHHRLIGLLRAEPHNEKAWLWFVETLPDRASRIQALERCLQLNPTSQLAWRGLQRLQGGTLKVQEARRVEPEAPATTTPEPATLPDEAVPEFPAPPARVEQQVPVSEAEFPTAPAAAFTQPAPPAAAPTPPVTHRLATVRRPAPSPATRKPTPRPPSRAKPANRRSLYLAAAILAALMGAALCVLLVFALRSFPLAELLPQAVAWIESPLSSSEPTATPSTPQAASPPGVYLIESGQAISMQRSIGEPASGEGAPRTDQIQPYFRLNDPQINQAELRFVKLEGQQAGDSIPLEILENNGELHAVPKRVLDAGVYCFILATPSTPVELASFWCIQVVSPNQPVISSSELATIQVTPPGNGAFLLQDNLFLPLSDATSLAGSERQVTGLREADGILTTQNRQPVLAVQGIEFNLTRPELIARPYNTPGFYTQWDTSLNRATVVLVDVESPAALLGLQNGDGLLSVNGNPVDGLMDEEINILLVGLKDSTVKVAALRGDQLLEAELARSVVYDLPRALMPEFYLDYMVKNNYILLKPSQPLVPMVYCLTATQCFLVK